jgi:hypothetical protein
MDIQDILDAVDHLPDDELARLKRHITQREADRRQEAQVWGETLSAAAAAFRGESSPEELDELFDAIQIKS